MQQMKEVNCKINAYIINGKLKKMSDSHKRISLIPVLGKKF